MTDKQQIEEMITIMKNTQCPSRADSEYPIACDECPYQSYEMSCSYKQHAEALYNAGYRRVGESEVVVTKDEWEDLQGSAKAFDTLFVLFRVLIALLGEVRKATAKEIFEQLRKMQMNFTYDVRGMDTLTISKIYIGDIYELAKQYGVEVEE